MLLIYFSMNVPKRGKFEYFLFIKDILIFKHFFRRIGIKNRKKSIYALNTLPDRAAVK
jgi:hypothetical protein